MNWFDGFQPENQPTFESLRLLIQDQPWFFQWWTRDPTIQSALAMLEAIHGKFRGAKGFYNRISGVARPYITFQWLDLENFGLSDDLYIKMNARGKLLTAFEAFKAMLEKHIGEVFPEVSARRVPGQPPTLKAYFSHRIDTTWADLFWAYRDPVTNLFDGQIMNLVQAVGIITRNPTAERANETFEALRGPGTTLSFRKYLDNTCLDRSHIDLLVTLLDACSDGTGGIRTHLPDRKYFNERKVFRRIVEQGGQSTYADLVQFCAYAEFFRAHGATPNADRFSEWMRVVRNLTINSNIERPIQFLRSLRSVMDLLPHSGDILAFLVQPDSKIEGFSVQQIREERLKAGLISKSERWKKAVLEAEQHGYFKGQIEFLIDFSGVLSAWGPKASCDWTEKEDDEFYASFSLYYRKANLLFNGDGLIPLDDFRTERALLSIGDYMFEKGPNKSFLENVDDPISWKRLLRGEHVLQAGPRRGYVKQLLDKIDINAGANKSLDQVISTATVSDRWRRVLVEDPQYMDYCGKRQIRFYSDSSVYLLKGLRRSGDHADLYSYHLYLGLLSGKFARGEMAPFGKPVYNFVHTDSWEPSVTLGCVDGDVRLVLQIWNCGGKYRVRLYAANGGIPDDLKQDLERQLTFAAEDDGNIHVDVEIDKIEPMLDKIVEVVRKHVST